MQTTQTSFLQIFQASYKILAGRSFPTPPLDIAELVAEKQFQPSHSYEIILFGIKNLQVSGKAFLVIVQEFRRFRY